MKGSYDKNCLSVDRFERKQSEEIPDFWRRDDPLLDETGKNVVTGGMFSHQRDWWALPNFIKALVGGYGSGKTLIGSKRIIALALVNAPCPVAIVDRKSVV